MKQVLKQHISVLHELMCNPEVRNDLQLVTALMTTINIYLEKIKEKNAKQ